MRPSLLLLPALAAALAGHAAHAASYTYHGDLLDGDAPADGRYDIRVRSFAGPDMRHPLGEFVELPGVQVVAGRFALDVDVPEDADGTTWVEIAVRQSDRDAVYEVLGTPQPVTKANSTCPGAWALDGNTGLPAGSFLGIADAASTAPLVLKIADSAVATFTPRVDVDAGGGFAPSVALGSPANAATGVGATVGGGGTATQYTLNCPTCTNRAAGRFATVAGGFGQHASAGYSFIGGGYNSTVGGLYGAVVGGANNSAGETGASVVGGAYNYAGGIYAAVGGGTGAAATGDYSVAAGGYSNRATGDYSVIAGGQDNCAGGEGSWAGGQHAKARIGAAMAQAAAAKGGPPGDACLGSGLSSGDGDGDRGTFVWADSQAADFISSGDNQFLVRAGGGVLLNTSTYASSGADDLVVGTRTGAGDADSDIALISRGGRSGRIYLSDSTGALAFAAGNPTTDTRFNFQGSAQAGRYLVTGANQAHLTTGGAWTNGSSRLFKQAFEAIDTGDILARVLQLPLTRWQYRESGEGMHLGPMAEDFADAFGLGGSPQHISTVDADGVALAAIQGLNAKLERENAALQATLDDVLARLARLEAGGER